MVRNAATDHPNSELATAPGLEERIGRVGTALTRSITSLLAALPAHPRRPAQVSRALGVNKDLSSKLLIAAGKRDPLAAAYYMPGPEALRKVLHSAATRAVDAQVVADLDRAVAEFEALLRDETGGRSSLDAIISAWLPEARARFETANKQGAFRCMSSLKGVTAEVMVDAAIIHPSSTDPGRHDGLGVFGFAGLRRLRPGVPIRVSTHRLGEEARARRALTVDGGEIDAAEARTLLDPYCSAPPPRIEVRHTGPDVHYLVASEHIGLSSAVDLFFGELMPNVFSRYRASPPRRSAVSATVQIPAAQLVLDVLLHDDVWPGSEPELIIHDTASHGQADVNDPARCLDRFDLLETIQPLGRGVGSCRIAEVPAYVDLLRDVCTRRGWDPRAFRCFRCHCAYPIYGSQVQAAFWPPVEPHQ